MTPGTSAASRDVFVARYGGIYEHSPWVADRCFAVAANVGSNELARLFAQCVNVAEHDTKLQLIRAHPDLAGRAAVRGELTEESAGEQASAGIDQCSAEEYAQFIEFNTAYRDKFGFPFVMAVKNSNRHAILAAFAQRLENDADTEFETAIQEIHKIARLRLEAMHS